MNIRQPVLLAVDDDPMSLAIIEEYLTDSGYQIRFAENGERALEILQEADAKIDLLLLDRMLPGISGIEVLKQVKQSPMAELIPVVLITAADEPEQVSEGIRAGCFYYLTKPFNRDVLCEVVISALRDNAWRTEMQTGLQKLTQSILEERFSGHQATMVATYYFVNNVLNLLQLTMMEIEAKGTIDDDVLREIKTYIFKTATQVRELGQLENPTRENIEEFIKKNL